MKLVKKKIKKIETHRVSNSRPLGLSHYLDVNFFYNQMSYGKEIARQM